MNNNKELISESLKKSVNVCCMLNSDKIEKSETKFIKDKTNRIYNNRIKSSI